MEGSVVRVGLGTSGIGVEGGGLTLEFPRALALLLEAPQAIQGRVHRRCPS